MRYISIADIHGNYDALEAIINDAFIMYGSNIDGFIFLGDYACDFLDGNKVIQKIIDLKRNYKVYAIKGNRENWIVSYNENGRPKNLWDIDSSMGPAKLSVERMTDEQINFVCSLPDSIIISDISNYPPILLNHKMPLSNELLLKVKNENIDTIITAHTHEPHEGVYSGIKLFNPGAATLSDTGEIGARYGVLTWKNNKWMHESKLIQYNIEKVISDLENEPLLFTKCKKWGRLLALSLQTGMNITAFYMFELQRLGRLKHQFGDKANFSPLNLNDNIFGQGRYGNINPFGKQLEETHFIAGDTKESIQKLKVFIKTDEGISAETENRTDELWDMAWNNILEYLKMTNENIYSELFKGRRESK